MGNWSLVVSWCLIVGWLLLAVADRLSLGGWLLVFGCWIVLVGRYCLTMVVDVGHWSKVLGA